MAALLFTNPLFSSLSSTSSSSTTFIPNKAHPSFLRLCNNSIALHPKTYVGSGIRSPLIRNNGDLLIVKASSDVDGAGPTTPEPPTPPPPESNTESVPVENLPLESKLQLKLEQQMRMKKAKKIRLKRKRLVRKRHLRKKGRWPPSKLKKNKNV